MGKHFKRKTRPKIWARGRPVSSEYKSIVQVQEVRNIETEEIEMNEISSKSLDISISDPEGKYPQSALILVVLVWTVRGYLIKGNSDESLNVSLWEDGLDNEPIVGNIRIGLNCASPLSDEDLVEIQKLPSPNVFKWVKISILILFYLIKINKIIVSKQYSWV